MIEAHKHMKSILFIATFALFAAGCDEAKAPAGDATKDPAPKTEAAGKTTTTEAPKPVTQPPGKRLAQPIADGVEVNFAYTNAIELPTAPDAKQRAVMLVVNELPPSEAMAQLAAQLIEAGFVESTEQHMHKHQLLREGLTINLNYLEYKPGDKNGLGAVNVDIITK